VIDDETIAAHIVRLLAQRAATSSICPSEVARAVELEDGAWRALMPQVREVAARLRDAGRLRITRGGHDIDPAALHTGTIRLVRGPRFDEDL
jgi:hypothetical protein